MNMNNTVIAPEERFWSKVRLHPTGCWEWNAAKFSNGYGSFYLGKIDGSHRVTGAHRASLILTGMDVPDDKVVCHKCDNPGCVRPSHLFVGTQVDNVADKIEKGRHRFGHVPGIKNGRSKLTDSQVVQIRKLVAGGRTRLSVAHQYGVTHPVVNRIISGTSWTHVA